MERSYKHGRLLAAGTVLLFLLALVLCGVWDRMRDVSSIEQEIREELARQSEETVVQSEESGEAEEPPYVSPIDFERLQRANPDIYAWLEIPGTEISYPLLQHGTDDTYYLNHDSSRDENKDGAIFTEGMYNSRDMEDPVTVVYGHHMKSGTMFGHLQELYSGEDSLELYPEIVVYLPDKEITYRVFASFPANRQHILYYYDFSDPELYQLFLDRVFSVRSPDARFDDTVSVSTEDQLLILSTCLNGNSKARYLVLAKRT